MPYDWNAAASGTKTDSEQLAPGYHRVKIKKVLRANKDGVPYTTAKGDAKLLVIYEAVNGDGERLASFVLSDAAIWKLAQSVKDWDAAKIDAWAKSGNVTPESFWDESFAAKELVGMTGWVNVVEKGKYTNVDHVAEEDVPADVLQRSKPSPVVAGVAKAEVGDEDIPF